MKRRKIFAISALVALAILSGCSPPAAPAEPPAARAPAGKAVSVEKWDSLVEAAKKEGTVVIYSTWRPETRILLTQAIKDKFGITLEFAPVARGEEMLAKVQAQRAARLNVVDVLGGGPGPLLSFKKEGLLGQPLEPLLILPEVKDPAAWRGGQLPFMDQEKRTVGLVAVVQRRPFYNTTLVKENEIAGYRDLLKPQYRGKIILNDPSVTGAGSGWIADLARDIWNAPEAAEYLRQLIVRQEVVISRDNRLVVETVARGKYSVGLAPSSDVFREFLNLGAPLNFIILKEGVFVGPGGAALGLAVDPPHPNATTVFLNWLMTREGQTLFALKGFGSPSFRLDVPVEGIPPMFLLAPGEKFWTDSEELNAFRAEMMEMAKKVMEEATKK